MKYRVFVCACIALCCTVVIPGTVHAQTTFAEQQNAHQRVRQARENRMPQIDSLFAAAGIAYPPKKILLAAYKHERVLELWARSSADQVFTIVKTYPFTAFSGTLGPKNTEGDLQIPEGLYHIDHFNPFSAFHLSMKINYPNLSDHILGVQGRLGGEIRIHGSSVTIGCIPIGDNAIEELYIICVDTRSAGQNRIPVYIFPARMHWTGMKMLEAQAVKDTLLAFWHDLQSAYTIFQRSRQELEFTVNEQGQYVFAQAPQHTYAWIDEYVEHHALSSRIPPPSGYERAKIPSLSFAEWLRGLPMKPGNPPVYLYNGAMKTFQTGHHALVDMDVGHADLQQCADALMRLFAEYLYQVRDLEHIVFRLTNGDTPGFLTWAAGMRPRVNGSAVTWQRSKPPDSSYAALKQYLQFIFTYAGSFSLQQQLHTVADINGMQIGDIFIQGGFPGHAVMVCDMAYSEQTGDIVFLLVQSYMPAQDVHVLKNLSDPALSPWYRLDFGDTLYTPEWTFTRHDLMRW